MRHRYSFKSLLVLAVLIVFSGFGQEHPQGRFQWENPHDSSEGFRIVLEWDTESESILILPPQIPDSHLLKDFVLERASTFSGVSNQGMAYYFRLQNGSGIQAGLNPESLSIEYEDSVGKKSLAVEVPAIQEGLNPFPILAGVLLSLLIFISIWKYWPRVKNKDESVEQEVGIEDLRRAMDQKQWDRFFQILKDLAEFPFVELSLAELEEMEEKYRFTRTVPSPREIEKMGREFRRRESEGQRDQEEDAILSEVLGE